MSPRLFARAGAKTRSVRGPRRWIASVAAAAALNVELITGSVPDAPRRQSNPIAWVARSDEQSGGLDAREMLPGRSGFVVACDVTRVSGRRKAVTPPIGPN